jgi:hypothetical protein
MPERSIDELLARLPGPVAPDPSFEAALRSRLAAELRETTDVTGQASSRHLGPSEITEVIELQTLTPPTDSPSPMRSRYFWLRAAAVLVLVGGVAAVAVALTRDDPSTTGPSASSLPRTNPPATGSPSASSVAPATTVPTTLAPTTVAPLPPSTFAGATIETFAVELEYNPYFVASEGQPWLASLAGELVRLDPSTGEIVARAQISESSAIAVDGKALWVADALTGDVVRLDPQDGSVVAEIATGVEILRNSVRFPMLSGEARDFASIGGIDATGTAVWVGDRSGALLHVDPSTNEVVGTFDVPVTPDHVRADGDRVVVANLRAGDVAVVDAATGEILEHLGDLGDLVGAELFDGGLYLQRTDDGTVIRNDLETGEQTTSVPLGPAVKRDHDPTLPTGLVVTASGVLADTANQPDSLHVLDPITLADLGTLPVTADQGDVTVAADGSAWLVRTLANQVVHIVPAPL